MAELIEVDDLTQIATVVVENVETITVDGSTDSITIDAPATVEVIDVATPGPQGEGMPAGGLENQVAYKQSDTDFDIGWETLSADLVAYDDTGNTYITGSTVQAALDETDAQGAIVHQFYLDVADAFGTIADFIVQILATAGDLEAHLTDTVDAHDASAISVVPAGSIAATDVQAALVELDSEKSPLSHVHSTSDITSLAEFVRDTAGLTFVEGANIEITVDDPGDTITIGVTGSLGVSDHGALTGLTDDDHLQYLLADGSRDAAHLNVVDFLTVGGAYLAADLNDPNDSTIVTDGRLILQTGQQSSPGVSFNGQPVVDVPDPVDPQDADTLAARNAAIAAAIAALVDTAPSTLDTLNELAAALGDDPNFATTIAAMVGDHISDTSDAHDASAISILDTANDFTATNVEDALAELQSDAETLASAVSTADALRVLKAGDTMTGPLLVDGGITATGELVITHGEGNVIIDGIDWGVYVLGGLVVDGVGVATQTDVEAAPVLLPTTDARNVIQPSAATVTPLTLRGFAAQSDPLLSLQNSSSTVLAYVSAAGKVFGTGLDAGSAVISSVATGVAGTDAVNVTQLGAAIAAADPGFSRSFLLMGA